MCDRPVGIVFGLVAGIKSIPTESRVQNLSNESAYMNEFRSAPLNKWIPAEKNFIKTVRNVLIWYNNYFKTQF